MKTLDQKMKGLTATRGIALDDAEEAGIAEFESRIEVRRIWRVRAESGMGVTFCGKSRADGPP
jgi:hypothetical protein